MSMDQRQDKMTADADWREGMNAFRMQTIEALAIINEEIKKIQQKIKETP